MLASWKHARYIYQVDVFYLFLAEMFCHCPTIFGRQAAGPKSIYSNWMMERWHRIEFTLLHHTRQNNHFNDLNPVTSEVSAVQHASLLLTTYCKFTLLKYWLKNWTQTTDQSSAF